jgi:hypothetical protein
MSFPIVSATCAGVLMLAQMLLMVETGWARIRRGQLLGEAADEAVLRSIRRHANLTENAAIFLVVLALLELAGAPTTAVSAIALAFLLARAAHAAGFAVNLASPYHAPLRGLGFLLTAMTGSVAGGWLIWLAIARAAS